MVKTIIPNIFFFPLMHIEEIRNIMRDLYDTNTSLETNKKDKL